MLTLLDSVLYVEGLFENYQLPAGKMMDSIDWDREEKPWDQYPALLPVQINDSYRVDYNIGAYQEMRCLLK